MAVVLIQLRAAHGGLDGLPSLRKVALESASPAGLARMASRACPTSGRAAIHSSNVMSAPVRCAASRYAVKAISRQYRSRYALPRLNAVCRAWISGLQTGVIFCVSSSVRVCNL